MYGSPAMGGQVPSVQHCVGPCPGQHVSDSFEGNMIRGKVRVECKMRVYSLFLNDNGKKVRPS